MASSADESPSGGVCLTCGRVDCRLEEHHPAGEANVPGITVPECTPGCHEELTEKQRDAGIGLSRDDGRSEAERRWALLSGVADVIGLAAKNRGMPELAAALGPAAGALGRLLAFSSPAEWQSRTGAAGDVGPDPRRNDLRKTLRARQGRSLPDPGGDGHTTCVVAERSWVEELVGFIGQVETYLFAEDAISAIDRPRLTDRLNELTPDTINRLAIWGQRLAPTMAAAVMAVCSTDPDTAADALVSTAWVGRLLRAVIALFEAIAASRDADEAERLLGAFMEAWPAPILTAA